MGYAGPPFGWTVPADGYGGIIPCPLCGRDVARFDTAKGNRVLLDPDGRQHVRTCSGATVRRPEPRFESPTARGSDPETSHDAAADATPRAGTNRRLAYETLLAALPGGLTDFELAARTGVAQTSIGVRRKELVRAGLAEATSMTRPAPSGSAAIVWRAIPSKEDPT